VEPRISPTREHQGSEAPLPARFGAVVGGTLGWLAGIGALAIPGLAVHRGRSIMGMLAGLGAGGAVVACGHLVGFGIPEYEASATKAGLRKAHSAFRALRQIRLGEEGRSRLKRTGAQDIASSSEASADFARATGPASQYGW